MDKRPVGKPGIEITWTTVEGRLFGEAEVDGALIKASGFPGQPDAEARKLIRDFIEGVDLS